MIVREGRAEDVRQSIILAKQMHEETEFQRLSWDEGKVWQLAQRLVTQPDHCFLILEDKGEIVGMFLGYVCEHYFSRDLLAKDYLFYIRPDKRGGRGAVMLMNAFMKWVENYKHPIAAVVVGVSTGGEHMERADKFYAHYGLEPIGGLYRSMKIV